MARLSYTPTTGVVVTGGGSGIGRACCLALAEAGRPVAAWDLDGAGAKETAELAAGHHDVASVGLEVDVADASTFSDAVARSKDALGSIGGLVHAAGVPGPMPVDFLDEDQWDAVLDVNLRAEALLVRALLDELRAAKPGSAVVGIASVEAIVGNAMLPAYCSSKAGLLGLTRSLAHRLAGEQIRVNAVCPGAIETPMLAPALANESIKDMILSKVPLARVADPMEVARVIRFLLSDDASYVTGEYVVVDGGMTTTS
ncbi:MAG: SDR family oxidoreductase [Actinobacteria bacterium]|nr:SDR family oxidoreductase [Actinomycetota bacterium]